MASNDFGLRTINHSDFEDGQDLWDVVVVHGLYGSSHSSWTDIKWEAEFLPSLGGGLIRYRLSLYTYDVFGFNGGILTRGGARDEATKLLDSLLQLRHNGSENMPITFVVHDLGGTLVKEAVVIAQQKRYEGIYTSIALMVFLGCPHQGPKADLRIGCADLLMSHKNTTYLEAWDLSGPLVEWVQDTNGSFTETRIWATTAIWTSISIHPDPKLRVFGKFATSMVTRVGLVLTDLGHKDLLKDPVLNSLGWDDFIPLNDALHRRINNLMSRAPPWYLIDTTPLTKEQHEPSSTREAFMEFINSDGAGPWLIHCLNYPGCSAVEAAEQIVEWTADLIEQTNKFSYSFFSFDVNDCYRDSAEAALASILVELCSQYPDSVEKKATQETLEPLNICRITQVEDLFTTYVSLILLKISAWRKSIASISHTIILGNLDDRIINGGWLFKKLEEIIYDCGFRLKIIVTSSDPASLTSHVESSTAVRFSSLELGNVPLRLEEEPIISENKAGSDGVKADDGWDKKTTFLKSVLALIQDRPQLYDCSVALELLAQSCGKDKKLWEMIVNWLKHIQVPEEDRMQDLISQLVPATPDKLFRSMLISIPSQVRSSTIILFERILFAFRPLTLSELHDLELLDWPDEPQHGLPGASTMRGAAERFCGGLLTVQRKEVRLAHPRLRGFLTSTKQVVGGWLPLDSAASIHRRIAVTCLNYLSSPRGRQLMEHRAGPGRWHTPFECRDDFLSYAIKYWLRHATHADKGVFETDTCTSFLADDDAVRLWAILYQCLSPLTVNRDMPSINILASLAIFAEHGAEDLLTSTIEKHKKLRTRDLSHACLAAVVAAAGLGNIRIVKQLLAFPLPEGSAFDQAILAAIESGNKDVFVEIFNIGQKSRGIRNFTLLLARAASLGHTGFAKVLLETMKVSNVDYGDSHSLSPLSYACQRGYSEIVELLISEGGPTVMSELEVKYHTPLPIRLAVQFGKTEILEILRSAVARQPADSAAIDFYRSIFTESSIFSRRRPVKNLLDYLDRNFRHNNSDPTEDESNASKRADQENMVISYLHHKVIDISSRVHPEDAILRVIDQWPHAIDLLDFLIRPKRSVMEDPQFPSYLETWIEAAVTSNDMTVVKLVYENGAKSPLATPQVLERVATAGIMRALSSEFTLCMKYLIEKGVDITSYSSSFGRTPLLHAVWNNLIQAVEVLIEAKVDVNVKGDDVWFPIHISYNKVDITRQLIAAGADVNVLSTPDNGEGVPSLYFAVGWDFPGVVDELLKAKPSRETLQSGLGASVDMDKAHMVEKLLPHCPDPSYLLDIDNLLHSQVKNSKLKNVQLLLGHPYRLDPNRTDSDGDTALHFIKADTSVEVVELLITHGAGIELVNNQAYTPLAVAAGAPNTSVVKCLIEHGALINAPGVARIEPFLCACSQGSLEMVKIMHTSEVDPVDVNHVYPINMTGTSLNAALLRDEETADKQDIIQYLLKEGHADPNIPSMCWSGALQVACLTSTVEMVRILIEQYHADVNTRDSTGRSPLHIALYRTREHVELLLEHGAELDAVDITKRNALHFAVLSGRLNVVKLVLDKRPEFVDQEDDYGWTPLLWALRVAGKWGAETSQMCAIIKELVGSGARRFVRGQGIDRTWTPMKIAKYYSVSAEVIELLTPTPENSKTMSEDDREWDWKSGGGKRGIVEADDGWCDYCLLGFRGPWYNCVIKTCSAAYCLHCYQLCDKLHIPEHQEFVTHGAEEDDASDDGGDSSSNLAASEPGTEQLEIRVDTGATEGGMG